MTQQIVGFTEAAKAEGVNKSTIFRWVEKYPHLRRSDGKRTGVYLEELRAHRAAMVNREKADNHAGGIPRAMPEAPAPAVLEFDQVTQLQIEKRKEELIALQTKNRKEAGELVARADVAQAFERAAGITSGSLRRNLRPLALKVAALDDPRAIETEIEGYLRAAMEEAFEEYRLALRLEKDDAADAA